MTKGIIIGAVSLFLLACNNSAVPDACLDAMRDKGVPERIVEMVKKPGDLNAWQRKRLNSALEKAGVGDVCRAISL